MDEIKITEIERAESAFKIIFTFLFIVVALLLAVVIYSVWRYIFPRKTEGQACSGSSPQPSDTGHVASSPHGLGISDSEPSTPPSSQRTSLTDTLVKVPCGMSGQKILGTTPTDSTCTASRRSHAISRTQSGSVPTASTSSEETSLTDISVKVPCCTSGQASLGTSPTSTTCKASRRSHKTSKIKVEVDFHSSGQTKLDTSSQPDLALQDFGVSGSLSTVPRESQETSLTDTSGKAQAPRSSHEFSQTDDTQVKVPVGDSSLDIGIYSLESSQSLRNNVNPTNNTPTSLKLSSLANVLNVEHKEATNKKYHTINKETMELTTQDNFHSSNTSEAKHQTPESDNTPDPTGATDRKVAQEHDEQTKIEDERMPNSQGNDGWCEHVTRETDPVHPSSFVGTCDSDPNEQQEEQLALLADD